MVSNTRRNYALGDSINSYKTEVKQKRARILNKSIVTFIGHSRDCKAKFLTSHMAKKQFNASWDCKHGDLSGSDKAFSFIIHIIKSSDWKQMPHRVSSG